MPLQCPHCHSTIELGGKPPRDVVCPSCGATIQLECGSTTRFLPDEAPRHLGRFELLEQLGVGGFGAVYKARDTELDRTVAIKVPRAGNIPRPEDVDRFLREARSAAQLKHPSIVALYDAGQGDGTCYLVSEFIQGATLAQHLSAKRLSFRQAAELIAEVADALDYAHKHGVIHRDLKPSNIMLDLEAKPHLMDFGLAKRAADEITMTIEGQVLGTPAYMSPEQAKGEVKKVDGRSDVYSLGVILYELLTGELPFRGQTRMLLVQVIRDEPRPPRRLNDRIPRDLETICLKALAKEPGRRFQTAGELADDLQRFLKGEPIKARPAGRVERAWRWCCRNPAVAGLLTAVAVSLLLGTVIATLFGLHAEQQRRRAERNAQEARDERDQKDRALLRSEWLLYASQIALAEREWQSRNAAAAWYHLEACRQDFRGWEHDYLYTLFNKNHRTFRGPTKTVNSLAFSPDGSRLAIGSGWDDGSAGELKVWDATSGQEVLSLQGHTGAVYSVAFSPDGQRLASGSGHRDSQSGVWTGDVKIWDAATGQLLSTLQGHKGRVNSVAFSPDGQRLASGTYDYGFEGRLFPGEVKVWDVAAGEVTLTMQGHTQRVTSVAFSPDGTRLASGSQAYGPQGTALPAEVKVWNAVTGQETLTITAFTNPVWSVAFSPDGRRLAGGSWWRVNVCDAATGQLILTLPHTGGVVSKVAFSPDGKRIASGGGDGIVKVWDATSGQEVLALQGHTSRVTSVAYSPDGMRLASSSGQQDGQSKVEIKVWDLAPKQEPLTLRQQSSRIECMAYSPDGRRLASGGRDGMVKVWDPTAGREVHSLKGHTNQVNGVAFSPDGTQLASGSHDHTVKIWEVVGGQEVRTIKGHTDTVWDVAYSPDGQRIASGGGDGTVKVWDASSGQQLLSLTGHTDLVISVAFSPDGKRIVSGSHDKTVKVWDAAGGQEVLTLKGHAARVGSVAFSHDGQRIASGSTDWTVRVWDAHSGQELLTLKGHTLYVHSVAFSPDGKRIASGSDDKTVKVWATSGGQEVFTLKGHALGVSSVAFSPDGKRLASASGGTITIWDGSASPRR